MARTGACLWQAESRGEQRCCGGQGLLRGKLRGGLGEGRQDTPRHGGPSAPFAAVTPVPAPAAAVVGPAAVCRHTSTLRREPLKSLGGYCWSKLLSKCIYFFKEFLKIYSY